MIRARITLAIAFVLLPTTARAQASRADLLTHAHERSNAVEIRVGAEDAFVAEVAYARAVAVAHRPWVIDAQLDVPWAELDARDWRVRLGAAMPIALRGRWHVLPRIAPTLRVSSNDTARLVGVGVDVGAVTGYYAPHWFAGAEVGFDADLTTHIAPSAAYRMRVNDRASSGWYGTVGGELSYGITVGATAAGTDVALRVGRLLSTDGDPPTLPFVAMLSVARRW